MKRERVEKTFWDTDFFEDSRIEEITEAFGDAAPAYYMRLALRMLREGGPIRFSGAVAILKKNHAGIQAESFVNHCISIGLFTKYGDEISSERVEREIASLREKRNQWNERKKKQKESRGNPAGITRDSEQEQEQEQEQEKELGRGGGGKPFEPPPEPEITYPPGFDTPGIRDWVPKVREKLRQHSRSLDQLGFEALCARYGGYPEPASTLEKALKFTCSLTSARNVVDPPDDSRRARDGPRKSNLETLAELRKQYEGE